MKEYVSVCSEESNCLAQCYGQFGELKDWWPKLLSSVHQTESKESKFIKSSSAICSAAN